MSEHAKEFWINDPVCLIGSIDFVPLPSMTLEEQLNALTRLVVLMAFLIIPFSCKKACVWVLIAIGLIVAFFSIKVKMRTPSLKECYTETTRPTKSNQQRRQDRRSTSKPANTVEYYSPQCNATTSKCQANVTNPHRAEVQYVELEYGPSFKSWNQALVGSPAPRTTVPPVLVPPPVSSEWQESSLVVRPGINTQTNQDLGRSGYIIQEDTAQCGDHCGEAALCVGIACCTVRGDAVRRTEAVH